MARWSTMLTGEELFWHLVEPMYADPAVQRSTMMGLPCVRVDGHFFASLDRRTGALLVKLPQPRVGQLIAEGVGAPFAPAGRTFREWVALRDPDRRRWRALLGEARQHVQGPRPAPRSGSARPTHRAPAADGSRVEAAAFAGFGKAGLAFLAGLQHDNTKAFFDAHREVYQTELFEPSKRLVIALGQALRERVSPNLRAEPRVGGSMFRIANDLRFNRDKPPYKTTLDFAFWEGSQGPRTDPSLLLRISTTEIHLGCGVFGLRGVALDRYRSALRDTDAVAEIDALITTMLNRGAELSDPSRVRPPAGFDGTGPAVRLAVRDGFHVIHRVARPTAVTSVRLVPWCAERLARFGPIHRWLVTHTR